MLAREHSRPSIARRASWGESAFTFLSGLMQLVLHLFRLISLVLVADESGRRLSSSHFTLSVSRVKRAFTLDRRRRALTNVGFTEKAASMLTPSKLVTTLFQSYETRRHQRYLTILIVFFETYRTLYTDISSSRRLCKRLHIMYLCLFFSHGGY